MSPVRTLVVSGDTVYAGGIFSLAGGLDRNRTAAFSATTDQMRDTGDLIVPRIGGTTHLNATPLYNWLTLAVRPAFDGGPKFSSEAASWPSWAAFTETA